MPKRVNRKVEIDPSVILDLMEKHGYTQEDVGKLGRTSRAVVSRAINEREALPENLAKIAMGLHTVPEALLPQSMAQRAKLSAPELAPPYDCEILEYLSDKMQAANGIIYFIAKLQSTVVRRNVMRGKYYDLSRSFAGDSEVIATRIQRHGEVCTSLAGSTYLAKHRLVYSFEGNKGFWVLDDWIPGKSLRDLLADGVQFNLRQISEIGRQILHGLNELHASGIVMRELAPERICVSDDFCHVTLTDFEMAKIMQRGVPSVSGEWKTTNPYRAPEHIPDSEFARVATPGIKGDIYSWAAVVCKMLTDNPKCQESDLSQVVSDTRIVKFLLRCRSQVASKRSASVAEVLEVWKLWCEANSKS